MAKQTSSFRRFLNNITPPLLQKNVMGNNISRLPLFNKGGVMRNEASQVILENEDYYKDYLYAAIKVRANRTAQLAVDSLKTFKNDNSKEDIESDIPHPYLLLIDSSKSFQNYWFWQALSTYIDLKGFGYIFALRNFDETKFGSVQEFKVLNPYKVQRIIKQETGELGGYVEWRGSQQRQIPVQMMIEVRSLNPFNLNDGHAMVASAENNQFLNQTAGTYTRHAIKNNVGQRGLLTSEVLLEDEDFENFKSRVEAQGGPTGAGKFIYGNGPGALNYTDMQVDLDKLALDKINEISREGLFAVAGVSKTILGIEMSGVTRESGKVQKDLFTENQTMPQLQLIVDAFNQDYRNAYSGDYERTRLEMRIDNPLKTDRESELTDAQVIKTKAESAKLLVQAGFEPASILEQVGLDEMDFTGVPTGIPDTVNKLEPKEDKLEVDANSLDDVLLAVQIAKQTTLENDIQNIQARVIQAVVAKTQNNDLSSAQEDKIISKKDKDDLTAEIATVLAAFYLAMIPLLGSAVVRERFKKYKLPATFKLDNSVRAFISKYAVKSSQSHMDTILNDIYKTAQEASRAGLGRDETVRKLVNTYNDTVSKVRAKTIARTEANRTAAQAQYEADKQFIRQNGLEQRAYKQWVTRSSNPCSYCLQLESETASNPIPFDTNFLDLGGSITAEVEGKQTTYVAGYEPIGSGTLHPNCSCVYAIIIK